MFRADTRTSFGAMNGLGHSFTIGQNCPRCRVLATLPSMAPHNASSALKDCHGSGQLWRPDRADGALLAASFYLKIRRPGFAWGCLGEASCAFRSARLLILPGILAGTRIAGSDGGCSSDVVLS